MEATYVQVNETQTHDATPENETLTWVKPGFKVIGVSLECTAYSGALL
jgi:hypothetical protein